MSTRNGEPVLGGSDCSTEEVVQQLCDVLNKEASRLTLQAEMAISAALTKLLQLSPPEKDGPMMAAWRDHVRQADEWAAQEETVLGI